MATFRALTPVRITSNADLKSYPGCAYYIDIGSSNTINCYLPPVAFCQPGDMIKFAGSSGTVLVHPFGSEKINGLPDSPSSPHGAHDYYMDTETTYGPGWVSG